MSFDLFFYYFIRLLMFPLHWMPYSLIHRLGQIVGWLGFYFLHNYRKRTLSNLALATDLHLETKQLFSIAKGSFQNLAINVLEYPKLSWEKDLSRIIQCENPTLANDLYQKGQGIIFFCGHQSNWEVLFLDGTTRMKGIAIGRPIKNKNLYQWIVKIREKNGGRIIIPHNALREGLKSLKKGIFLGIVGDQGMPDSGYSFPFLGRRAWTSTAPALLAYKTNSPIIVATTRRTTDGYRIHYGAPLFPDLSSPLETEVIRLMNASLSQLQESIKQNPKEWLWQHNRWKQQTPKILYKQFRHDCIAMILPSEKEEFERLLPHLTTLKKIYPKDFIFLMVPKEFQNIPLIEADETFYYQNLNETLRKDYRFKMVFNFTSYQKIKKHYKKLSAFEVLSFQDFHKIAKKHLSEDRLKDLSEVFLYSLCRLSAIPTLKGTFYAP
jgi:Kdo2-lipid IVA lauroyltransferase/acyltransferase